MVPEAESLLTAPPLGRTHTRAPSSTSTADMIEVSPPCCCQCHCQDQQLPSTSATATLRSNTSATLSAYSCNTSSSQRNCSHSCDHHLNFMCGQADSSTNFLPATPNNNNYTSSPSYISEDEDSVLRYSFKGIPPEMYSAKKEFIYRRPLVEKQLVLKKTCEWWFYKNKCSNMSTHWKQNAFLILATCILIFLGLIIFFSLPVNDSTKSHPLTELPAIQATINNNHLSPQHNWTTITTTTAIAPIITSSTSSSDNRNNINDDHDYGGNSDDRLFDITEITTYTNHTFEGDDDWIIEDDDIEQDIDDINNSIPEELTSDFVTPIKVHNFSLNADDLLYESKRNLNTPNNNNNDYFSAFSVTGTFRSKSSQIWDPHPEYILNAFGHQLHLVLHQDTSFIPPKTFRVINILNNHTEEEEPVGGHYLGCYYKGFVEGDDQSAVAVSLCHGMTGYIKTSFGSLLIQPVNNQTYDSFNTSATSEILHKIWRHSRRNARHAVSALELDLEEIEQSLLPKLHRKKRDYDRNLFTIELLVAVDRTMKEFHKDDLTSYILTLISIVSNIFADASIGNSIYISVANILVLNEFKRSRRRNGQATASQTLKEFCSHVEKHGYHYDTAMLITRDQICRKERETKCDTLGLAELGTVCKRKSCSIVQDNGLPAAFTIAHELGHILNMPHDDDDRCKQFNKPGVKRKLHIMSSVMGDDIHPWSWSDCSRHYVSEFLEKEDVTCLEDTPTKFIRNYNTRLPGEIYSLDHQCKLIHGNQSRYCHIETDCKRLWCKANDTNATCRSSNLPWADGTPCNNNRYWCQKGECLPREGHVRKLVNGGWGPWSPWSQCSLTCGGGVQESRRECNNPLPKNGGKYCTGARKKYRSCNTHNCPPGSMDAREQQCYQMNGRDFGIGGIGPHTKWIPKYGYKCGICEGRNDTCEDFTGNFYVSDLYKVPKSKTYYYHVTTIPKGASNIVIEQPGYHDENYIVLRDDQGNSLLNGANIITAFPNVSFYAGVAYDYNGSKSFVERVNTTYTRKLKRDMIVEIISMITSSQKDNDTLLMTYSYTIDKTNYVEPEIEIYRWEMQQWSTCDALCHGSMHRMPVCVSTTQALKVAPQFCDIHSKPPTEYRDCNTDCILTLNVTSISECSASCGMLGTREKTHHCIQTFPDMQRSNIVDLKYCSSKFEIKTHEECREGCWKYTDWMTCSRSCGYGMQTRSVACYLNQTFVRDEYCNLKNKANYRDTTRVCNLEPCSSFTSTTTSTTEFPLMKPARNIPNNWWAHDWGKCDDKCEKNRTVICRSPQGYGCPLDKKPISRRKCCTIKYVSNWSNCSVQCGNGTRRKEMHCARVFKPEIKGAPKRREFIDPSYCRHLKMPKPKRMHKPCKVGCKWSVSNWTQCPADCSEEYQSRSVYCESVLGNPINHTYCDAANKPPVKKICNNCVKREYKIMSSCNCEGYRRRRMLCYDSRRERIPCPTKDKIIREKCPPPRTCYPSSCYDLRRFHNVYADGEYTIYVRSVPKRIYCHNMHNSPQEFVTLNSTENYSIYYDYKITNPDLCPPDSLHREYRDDTLDSGRTTFKKIRIDIATLRVFESDFTFAESIGRPQPYGSAGDCYNRRKQCPQGGFSINLEHTGFRLRHGTVWEPIGHHVVMKESPSNSLISHRALCGGWCGGCRIGSNSALYLNV
ncbi:A disintegrin and metalloproteinase with thrombospondin motifs 9 isoform X2 [Lucilia cuprina]|uniref:A disintegrin and metalloproteinase with thrombospondin motifs 9 isoform X2 n=1 Tax=Lucilia cuprina TaxID=7375 RepID=UPI001F06D40D|nr:A disintegrin and metalloproteinase with thrombospondin motifs 9 isoform X2 [Lucilia cuprina]